MNNRIKSTDFEPGEAWFRFRIRVSDQKHLFVESEVLEIPNVLEKKQMVLQAVDKDKIRDAHYWDFIAGGFESLSDAKVCGQRVALSVVLTATSLGFGIDVGTGGFPIKEGESSLTDRYSTGHKHVHDSFGLEVFDGPCGGGLQVWNAGLTTGPSAEEFVKRLESAFRTIRRPNDSELLALELLGLANFRIPSAHATLR